MESSNTLKIDHLRLLNFRGFAECEIDFHPNLTVLVAENGRGKTAILDGVASAVGFFVDSIANTRQAQGIGRGDVRLVRVEQGEMQPVLPTSFQADGYIFGQQARWSRSLNGYGVRSRTTTREAEDVRNLALSIRKQISESPSSVDGGGVLPLVAYYGTGRLWSEHRLTKRKSGKLAGRDDRFSGYEDCLSSLSSFKWTTTWYENKWKELGDPKFSSEVSRNLPLVSAINAATEILLEPTEWTNLRWNAKYSTLEVTHPEFGILPMSALSDGVRTTLALVVDIARRCATLNPQFGEEAARKTPGILMIDEIDMHLHPRWQQVITTLLRNAFPSLQIILTTHSPHVLSTVDRHSIRVIQLNDGKSQIVTPEFQTRGVESAEVLSNIMGVDPIPNVEEAEWLREYRGLIEDALGRSQKAIDLRSKLEKHFGVGHPVILDADRLIRFQDFRLKSKGSEEK
ncbi:MAG: AAA family ATPase [Pseudobdellovibrionaceae bacterium]